MCAENNQNQENELEQIIASSPNYRTEEEAIALAGGLSEEEAGRQQELPWQVLFAKN